MPSPKLIPWRALKGQFGGGYKELYHFKNKWTGALQMALAVYPAAKVDVVDDGVVLKPFRPPVPPKVAAVR